MLDRIRALRGEVGALANRVVVGVIERVPTPHVSDEDNRWLQLQVCRMKRDAPEKDLFLAMLAYLKSLPNFEEYAITLVVQSALDNLKRWPFWVARHFLPDKYKLLDIFEEIHVLEKKMTVHQSEDPLAVRARQLARHGLIGPSQIPVMINCKSQPTLDAIASIESGWKQQNIGSKDAGSQIECYLKTYVRAYNLAQHPLLDKSSEREVLACTSEETLVAIASIQKKRSEGILSSEEASEALTNVLDANKLLVYD